MRTLATATLLLGTTVLATAIQYAPARAEQGLTIGSCVVTGYGSRATIIGTSPSGYKIRFDLTGGTAEQHHTGVTAAPCPKKANGPIGQPAPTPSLDPDYAREKRSKAVVQPPGRGACFTSETGRAGLEGTVKGVIRRQFERQAAAGSDGTTTIRFLSFRMDSGRRATVIDRVNYNPDMSRPVYSVRALLQTCTDYRSATATKTMERNFQCFTSSSGGLNCSTSGSMAGMRKDSNEYSPK